MLLVEASPFRFQLLREVSDSDVGGALCHLAKVDLDTLDGVLTLLLLEVRGNSMRAQKIGGGPGIEIDKLSSSVEARV